MKLRKAVSLILALVLALSMSVSAFAYSEASGEALAADNAFSDTYESVGSAPVVQMIVPSKLGGLVFNPLGLAYDASELLDDTTATAETDQVITKPMYIKNLSPANVQVDIKAEATVGTSSTSNGGTTSDAKPSTSSFDPTSSKSAAKQIFLYMEMYMPTVSGDGVTLSNASDFTGWYNGNYTTKSLPKNYSNFVVTAKNNAAVTKTSVAVLKAALPEDPDATGGDLAGAGVADLKPVTGGVLAFKLSGNAPKLLTEGEWSANDAPTVKLTFSFKFTGVESTYKSN